MSLVVRPGEDFVGSVDAHADVRISSTSTTTTNNENNEEEEEEEEIFERKSYVCTSIARDQIAFKVDANRLSRVVKGLVHVNATGARVKLLRRERRRKEENTTTNDNNNNNNNNNNNINNAQQGGGLTPVLCFSSFGGEIDIVQDVPIYGPLGRREVEDIATAIDTRRFEEVPYWLDLDYQSASVLREAVERLKFVSPRVEVVVGREGTAWCTSPGEDGDGERRGRIERGTGCAEGRSGRGRRERERENRTVEIGGDARDRGEE